MNTSHRGTGRPTSPAQLQLYAGRTLGFLNIIEKTIDGIDEDVGLLRVIAESVRRHIEELTNAETEFFDPSGRIVELLRQAAEVAHRSYLEAIRHRDSARADGDLHDDDGVVEGLVELVAAFAETHNALVELCDLIETLDARNSPRGEKVYTDVDAMLADILAGR